MAVREKNQYPDGTMTQRLSARARVFLKGPAGLGLILAWYYCVFYSCVLVWPAWTIRESERYWALALAVAAVAAVGLLALERGRSATLARSSRAAAAAVAACAAATPLIFAGYAVEPPSYASIYAGAALAGAALPVMCLQWAEALSTLDAGDIEFAVPAAFLVSLAIYLPLVALKSFGSIVAVTLLPPAAAVLLIRFWRTAPAATSLSADERKARGVGAGFARHATGLWMTAALFCVLWFSFAFFRSCVSPTYFTDRFDHYLIPFACAGLLAALFCVLALLRARSVGLFATYRWVVPFMCLGYAMVIIDDEMLSRLAFTASFVGLAGLQLCFAMTVAKQAHQLGVPVGYLLLPLLAAVGVGGAAGSACGLAALEALLEGTPFSYAPLMIVAVITAVMAWGVEGGSLVTPPERTVVPSSRGDSILRLAVPAATVIDSVTVEQARMLARRFGLSPREREILGYLLAGRSRPFIRDELVLSLNTVNTHVRNIYGKTGVHSQQELLTLARSLGQDDLSADLPLVAG